MIYEPSPHPAPPVSLVFLAFSSSNPVPKASPPTLPSDDLAISGCWSANIGPGWVRVCRAWVKPSILSPRGPRPERDKTRRPGAALAGEAERKGWPRDSGNRGPAGWITDLQGHQARGNHRPTPEERPRLQSEPY